MLSCFFKTSLNWDDLQYTIVEQINQLKQHEGALCCRVSVCPAGASVPKISSISAEISDVNNITLYAGIRNTLCDSGTSNSNQRYFRSFIYIYYVTISHGAAVIVCIGPKNPTYSSSCTCIKCAVCKLLTLPNHNDTLIYFCRYFRNRLSEHICLSGKHC